MEVDQLADGVIVGVAWQVHHCVCSRPRWREEIWHFGYGGVLVSHQSRVALSFWLDYDIVAPVFSVLDGELGAGCGAGEGGLAGAGVADEDDSGFGVGELLGFVEAVGEVLITVFNDTRLPLHGSYLLFVVDIITLS